MAENGFSKTGWVRHMIEIPWGRAAGTGKKQVSLGKDLGGRALRVK
jgi:hypothetical protein